MSQPRYRVLRILIPLFLLLFGCFTPPPPQSLPPEQADVVVLGEAYRLAPGSQANFLVQVRNPNQGRALPGRRVEVRLNSPATGTAERVFVGDTDRDGIVQVQFPVPKTVVGSNQTIEIQAETDNGERTIGQNVYVGQVYNVLVTTDKPVYQPGQVIHLRGLALDTLDLRAATAQTMTLTVQDPQGNKLMRRELRTSQYGIASTDFALDSQAPSGDYIITAEIGPSSSTRNVEVKPYTLPRFEVKFQPDKTFYLPGEMATGTVQARYFFGKPVAGGQVTIRGSVTDVAEVALFELSGVTGEDGLYRYEFQVPDYFVGQLDNRKAQVDLEIKVVDTANHAETIDDDITVAEKALLIDAVPESGLLRPGLENRIYLDVTYPDGAEAQAQLTVTGDGIGPITTTTDAYGLGIITLTAPSADLVPLQVVAVDNTGVTVTQPLLLGSVAGAPASILLRPDRSEYRIGDTLNADIYVNGRARTVYLDIIKDRQTFGLVALPVNDGTAQAALPIDGSLLGTIELNAYLVADDGTIVSDQRLALVNPAPADVAIQTDAEQYRPGDTAVVDIQVTRQGAPMPGAVGIAIVDESVFAVEAQDPGFARTYFLLERELQEPRYEIHDFVELESDDYSPYDKNPESILYGSGEWRVAGGEGGGELRMARGEGRGAGGDTGGQRVVAIESAKANALAGLFAQELALRATEATARSEAAFAPRPSPLATSFAPRPSPLAPPWDNRLYLLAPLLGIALYDGSRRRRKLLIALVVFSLGAFFWGACSSSGPAAAPAVPASMEAAAAEASTTATQGQRPPRLRQFFPETLYWMPELETDDDGRVQVDVPIADSITSWRISVLASDTDGNLGSAEVGMRVFQDFFVEPDLPRFLTVGDEIDVPVSVFNYLDRPQTVQLDVAAADWFEFTGEPGMSLELAANEVSAAYVPIRVTQFGTHELQITAMGSELSDAVVRPVEVVPDGKQSFTLEGGTLESEQAFPVSVPVEAVDGTGQVTVRIYPGIVSQVVQGLEGLLHEPYGCFEQTSSATYPNVLVLDYLKSTGQANPRIQLQAEHFINLGYQRLLTFEVLGTPGGFSLFGSQPAETMLTAYGLMEFSDMSEVAYVDPVLLERVASFLAGQQNGDGSWNPYGSSFDTGSLAATAYIAWGMADAGYADGGSVQQALRFLDNQLQTQVASQPRAKSRNSEPIAPPAQTDEEAALQAMVMAATGVSPLATPAPPAEIDVYTLALIANAQVASGEDATQVLDMLLARAKAEGDALIWEPGTSTYLGSYGDAATVETTAMVVQALLRAAYAPDAAQKGLNYLIASRDGNGSFYTTQATIQALKALLLATEAGGEEGAATVTLTLTAADGEQSTQTLNVDETNGDVVQQIRFDGVTGEDNSLTIVVEGDRKLQYQVIAGYYLPWEAVPVETLENPPMRVHVTYDRTELQVNDTVNVQAGVELLAPGMAGTVIVDLGIPPGFTPVTADLDALVDQGLVDRYELTGRQIILYLTNVRNGEVYTFAYRLQARFPIRAQTPGSQAYDYYAPEQRATDAPQRIVVTLGTPPE